MADAFETQLPKGFDKFQRFFSQAGLSVMMTKVREEFLKDLLDHAKKVFNETFANVENLGLEPLDEHWEKEKQRRGHDSGIWKATGALIESMQFIMLEDKIVMGWDNTPHPENNEPMAEIAMALELGVADLDIPARPVIKPTVAKIMEEAPKILRRTMKKRLMLEMSRF
jgi:hypothetical protein